MADSQQSGNEYWQEATKKGCSVVLAFALGIYILGSCAESIEQTGGAPQTAEWPLIKVTADEVFQAYEANEVAAQQAYEGKRIQITGRIKAITLDITDDPVIELETRNRYDEVQLSPDESTRYLAGGLKKGQTITATCTKISEVVGSPILRECLI